MKNLFLLSFLIITSFTIAQRYSYRKKQITQPGSMYFYWGYNRSIYAKSSINFVGDNYNFTIHKATADDRPSTDISTYFNITTISVPQFNIRMGWYRNNKWDFSFGYDHMKYVMTNGQEAKLTGFIPASENQYLNGVFNGEYYVITDKAIHYENTNGLNYISFQINYNHLFYRTRERQFAIRGRLGLGLGAVVTQTDFNWNGKEYHTEFKLSGYGASIHTGLRFEFFNRFFAQSNWSTGLINLPQLQTIANTNNYAKQKVVYADWQLVAGVFWYLKFKNGCDSCPDWH
ncbi:MAG TPA: hypothetical protein EYG85_02650 [Crocinitomix sp.]|nr:hypothetical protein [Crocinitomix sp.]